tara:strand:+ start:574 stop:1278 length:705 start_codon:yes stop_codon:yes gene_type:complete
MNHKTRDNLREYISLSNRRSAEQKKEYYLFDSVLVFVKDAFPVKIDLESVLAKVEKSLPRTLVVTSLDAIYVGEFENLLGGEGHTAIYEDGAIYVSNNQIDEHDVYRDLIHEIAHAVEAVHESLIFSDRKIENEFLAKRQRLYSILSADGYDVSLSLFLNIDFSEKMDSFLYKELGYPTLSSYIMGLFTSPYAVTSVREYYARGFEEYIYGDKEYLKKLSPSLYNVLEDLLKGD